MFAPLRSDASGVSDEAGSRRSIPAESGATSSARRPEQSAFHRPRHRCRVAIREVVGLPRSTRSARITVRARLRGRAPGCSSSQAALAASDLRSASSSMRRSGPPRSRRISITSSGTVYSRMAAPGASRRRSKKRSTPSPSPAESSPTDITSRSSSRRRRAPRSAT